MSISSRSDIELLQAWTQEDAAAGQALVKRYFGEIRKFFFNKVHPDEASDLIQETFKGCTESAARFRGENGASFRTFLFRIAHNKLHDHLRQKMRVRADIEFDEVSVEEIDSRPGPWTNLAKRREQLLVVQALRRIPINYQEILELHYWQRMSTVDIADVLTIPEPTARRRLQLARKKLKAQIERLARNPDEVTSTIADLERWAAEIRDRLERVGNEGSSGGSEDS